jgi:hypothetical protein
LKSNQREQIKTFKGKSSIVKKINYRKEKKLCYKHQNYIEQEMIGEKKLLKEQMK